MKKEDFLMDVTFFSTMMAMKKSHLKNIRKTPLFTGIREEDFTQVLQSLDCQLKHYAKDQVIIPFGKRIHRAGIVLEGSIETQRIDYWSRTIPYFHMDAVQLFLLEQACMHTCSEYTYCSKESCVILWLNLKPILSGKLDATTYGPLLQENLCKALATRTLFLMNQNNYLCLDNMKEKILRYLSQEALKQQSDVITIPFDRSQWAEYLCVERSALSRQLSRLQKEGWFTTRKNQFVLIKKEN